MNVINFSHPLTPEQIEQIVGLTSQEPTNIKEVSVQFEVDKDFTPQVVKIVDDLAIASAQWQSEPWLIALPSLNYGAAVLLAELHARMGHFPSIVRLKPVQQAFATQYQVAEIINLEQVRQDARKRR